MAVDLDRYLNDFPRAETRTLVMGILNITPDSFHDGGAYTELPAALAQLCKMIASGADIVDIGGMSSRPGHIPVSAVEELARITPLLRACAAHCPAALSVDTDKPEVAAAALAEGVTVINDCSGRLDTEMFAVAAQTRAPLIVMHRAGSEGEHEDIVSEAEEFFRDAVRCGLRRGMSERQFIFDPGLGFNKSVAENIALMRALPRLAALGRPLLVGYAHKRFVAALSGERPGQAPLGNAAAAAYCVLSGAHLVRVHEVEQFIPIARAIEQLK